MPIQILGTSGAVADVEGIDYRAVETTMRPTDHGSLGAYRIDAVRNDLTIGANMPTDSVVFSFWWRDPTRICVITQVIMTGMAGGPVAFTAGTASFRLFVARAWTVDTTGGVTVFPSASGGNFVDRSQMRSSMNSPTVQSCRLGLGALGSGTWVLDSNPIAQCLGAVGTTASTQWIPRTELFTSTPTDGPLVIHHQEGLALRATVPATGTWRFGMTVSWYELNAY